MVEDECYLLGMFLGLAPYSFVLEVLFLVGHILNVVCCSFIVLLKTTPCITRMFFRESEKNVLTSDVSEVLLGSDLICCGTASLFSFG